MSWEKGHHRLDRRRLKRVSVSPEEIGLCGCCQLIAVRRERVEQGRNAKPPNDEIGYYATSLSAVQLSDAELIQAIRDRSSAIENGSHHGRDVSFGEEASGVSKRSAAQVLACLRNLALGVYELAHEREQTDAPGAKACGRQMTFSSARARRGDGNPVWPGQPESAAPVSGTPRLPLRSPPPGSNGMDTRCLPQTKDICRDVISGLSRD